jgi:hypothetical protein
MWVDLKHNLSAGLPIKPGTYLLIYDEWEGQIIETEVRAL